MPFLLFLRGFLGVLLAFAITTYFITQSVWTTFIQTLICAVVIQIGYFIAILFMVWRSPGGEKGKETASGTEKAIQPAGDVNQVPGTPRSRLP